MNWVHWRGVRWRIWGRMVMSTNTHTSDCKMCSAEMWSGMVMWSDSKQGNRWTALFPGSDHETRDVTYHSRWWVELVCGGMWVRHRRDAIMFCRGFQITYVNRRQLEVKGEVSLKHERCHRLSQLAQTRWLYVTGCLMAEREESRDDWPGSPTVCSNMPLLG